MNGLGFAAVRDWNAWLRYETVDDFGTPNPLAGDIQRIFTEISSQPGRLLNDFRHLGFNQAENGRKVFDGMMQWISAGSGLNLNFRFSQPNRTERNRQDHLHVENRLPVRQRDDDRPVYGQDGQPLCALRSHRHLPAGGRDLLGQRVLGEDGVAAAHRLRTARRTSRTRPTRATTSCRACSTARATRTNKGNCQQFQNPLNSAPVQRALFLALDEWARTASPPPASRVPRLADGTMAPPLPQSAVGLPEHSQASPTPVSRPPATCSTTGRASTRPASRPSTRRSFTRAVSGQPAQRTDLSELRAEDRQRRQRHRGRAAARRDGAARHVHRLGAALGRAGRTTAARPKVSTSRSPKTKADRLAAGDPRPSVEERYPSFGEYQSAVMRAIDDLVKDRLMLCEDADDAAGAPDRGRTGSGVPASPRQGHAPRSNRCHTAIGNGASSELFDGVLSTLVEHEGPARFFDSRLARAVSCPHMAPVSRCRKRAASPSTNEKKEDPHHVSAIASKLFRYSVACGLAAAAALAWAPPSQARVTRIIIDAGPVTLAADTRTRLTPGVRSASSIPTIRRTRCSPTSPWRRETRTARSNTSPASSSSSPIDMAQASGIMWHDVPNRGGRITITADLRGQRDVGLSSGWQGDNAGCDGGTRERVGSGRPLPRAATNG